MYGTVAHLRVKPGRDLSAFENDELNRRVPGHLSTYVYQMDRDSQEYFIVVLFENKAAYLANAQSAEQHAAYLELLDALEAEPEWNDGAVIFSVTR